MATQTFAETFTKTCTNQCASETWRTFAFLSMQTRDISFSGPAGARRGDYSLQASLSRGSRRYDSFVSFISYQREMFDYSTDDHA